MIVRRAEEAPAVLSEDERGTEETAGCKIASAHWVMVE